MEFCLYALGQGPSMQLCTASMAFSIPVAILYAPPNKRGSPNGVSIIASRTCIQYRGYIGFRLWSFVVSRKYKYKYIYIYIYICLYSIHICAYVYSLHIYGLYRGMNLCTGCKAYTTPSKYGKSDGVSIKTPVLKRGLCRISCQFVGVYSSVLL